jgi:hypothetical protein
MLPVSHRKDIDSLRGPCVTLCLKKSNHRTQKTIHSIFLSDEMDAVDELICNSRCRGSGLPNNQHIYMAQSWMNRKSSWNVVEEIPASLLREGSDPDGVSTPLSSHFGSACVVIDVFRKQNEFCVPFGQSASSLGLGYPLRCVHG